MQWTIYSVAILFLISYILFGNWEIPIRLGFDPLKVVGGYPTLIDSYYEDFFDINITVETPSFDLETPPSAILGTDFKRTREWTCPILESSNQCISIVTSSSCLNSSQLSYNFWIKNRNDPVECRQDSKYDQCRPPFQSGNICENVVVNIQKSGESWIFDTENVQIGNQIRQIFTEKLPFYPKNESNYCQNYTKNDFVIGGQMNETEITPLFIFGKNYSEIVKYSKQSSETCESVLDSLFSELSDDINICNCANEPTCHVPILFTNYTFVSTNKNFCQIPKSLKFSIYHTHGYIYSVVVSPSSNFIRINQSESSSLIFKKSIIFYDLVQEEPQSRYSLSRGRFHCPSEVTCWLEIFYPLKYFTSLDASNQIIILIVSFLLSLLIF